MHWRNPAAFLEVKRCWNNQNAQICMRGAQVWMLFLPLGEGALLVWHHVHKVYSWISVDTGLWRLPVLPTGSALWFWVGIDYLPSHSLALSMVAGLQAFCTKPGQHVSHSSPQVLCSQEQTRRPIAGRIILDTARMWSHSHLAVQIIGVGVGSEVR